MKIPDFSYHLINSYFGRYMKSPNGGSGYNISDFLMLIGGIFPIINALALFMTSKPLGELLGILPPLNLGPLSIILGIVALIGGFMLIVMGFYVRFKKYAIIGSILGLISFCGLAIIGLIGALMKKK